MNLDELVTTLSVREGISKEEALEAMRFCRDRVLTEAEDPDEIIMEELGLEPDFLITLLLEDF